MFTTEMWTLLYGKVKNTILKRNSLINPSPKNNSKNSGNLLIKSIDISQLRKSLSKRTQMIAYKVKKIYLTLKVMSRLKSLLLRYLETLEKVTGSKRKIYSKPLFHVKTWKECLTSKQVGASHLLSTSSQTTNSSC